ncbi:MAG: histidine ammonia-lyase [Acidimicrobiia bacterium]|nr:histidine ammonia-lyase [Acidimicrobiia bacterium]
MTVTLSTQGLAAADVVAIARHDEPLALSDEARTAIAATSSVVDRILDRGESVYGVTTGFGALANTPIPPDRSAELQVALLRSHAAGMGPPVEREVVRAMMALRARSLSMGYSGVRAVVVERMVAVLNAGLTPLVPEHGSLGASGDLAPLAHCALCLIGEGSVIDDSGREIPAAGALDEAGIEALTLRPKEGLALINGTDGMLGMLVLALDDLRRLATVADLAAAATVEALLGTDRVFAADLQALRPQLGQADSAANLRSILADSAIVASHRRNDDRVQDAYSLRCSPAVHGSFRDVVTHAELIAGRELMAAIDNPMILPDGRVESCGNFHGAPLAHTADSLSLVVADIGALAERRTDRLLDPTRSNGLPPFLANDPGIDSGMMLGHYTQAAMVAENRRLATPASVDTIATSAMQEDHVSMGWGASRKLRMMIANLERILTIELVCACRAIELREPEPAAGTAAAIGALRSGVEGLGPDRWLGPELTAAAQRVADGSIVAAVEDAVGPLR